MRRTLFAIVLLSFLSVSGQQASDTRNNIAMEAPPQFVGDGCTWFPDGDYADCCLAHDRDYYKGGTDQERKASDTRLAQCVRSKGHKYLSRLMYLGVRVGGASWLRAPFSWGFGQRKKETKK